MHAGVAEECGHLQPGTHVLARGWRVHDDAAGAAVSEADAKIAAEAGIGGSGCEFEVLAATDGGKPVLQLCEAIQAGSPQVFV